MTAAHANSLSARQLLRWVLLGVLPMLAAVVGAYVYLQGGRYIATDNAYVKGDKVPVSAQVSGTVVSVMVLS
jgi:membrane fusion protein (multidrug efflux system)